MYCMFIGCNAVIPCYFLVLDVQPSDWLPEISIDPMSLCSVIIFLLAFIVAKIFTLVRLLSIFSEAD